MITKLKIMTVACLLTLYGISLNSQMVYAQDVEDNKITEPTTIEEQAPTRSPWLAVGMSLGGTLVLTGIGTGMVAGQSGGVAAVGTGFLVIGSVIAPSAGQWYSERWLKAGLFTLGRAGTAGLLAGGVKLFADNWDFICVSSNCPRHSTDGAVAMMVIGGTALVALTVWDIVDSYSSAKTFNKEHAKNSISVSPFVMPSESRNGEHGTAMGLAVAGHF